MFASPAFTVSVMSPLVVVICSTLASPLVSFNVTPVAAAMVMEVESTSNGFVLVPIPDDVVRLTVVPEILFAVPLFESMMEPGATKETGPAAAIWLTLKSPDFSER